MCFNICRRSLNELQEKLVKEKFSSQQKQGYLDLLHDKLLEVGVDTNEYLKSKAKYVTKIHCFNKKTSILLTFLFNASYVFFVLRNDLGLKKESELQDLMKQNTKLQDLIKVDLSSIISFWTIYISI